VASWSEITTLTTPGGVLTFNAGSGDTYYVDPLRSTGLGMGEIRAQVDRKGQASGSIYHEFFEAGAILVIAGNLLIRSAATEAGYVTARDALELDMKVKLRTMFAASGTLAGTGVSIVCKCNLGADFPSLPQGPIAKGFIFGLVSESVF